MNERIKQLADQAGLQDFVLTAMGLDEEVQNFAELIVKECIAVCWAENGPESSTDAGWALKEHFGIK